jgi:hypothetical protein
MKLQHLSRLLVFTLSCHVTITAAAEDNKAFVSPHNQEIAASRVRFPTTDEVPDRIALRWLSRIAAQKHDFAVAFVMSHSGADAASANTLVAYLAELHGNIVTERRETEVRVACYPGRPQPSAGEVFRLLDLVNEAQAVVEDKYRVIALADLGEKKLRPLLDNLKPGIGVSNVPTKDAFEGALPSAAINTLVDFCEARRN